MNVIPQVAGFADVVYEVFWTVSDTDGSYEAGQSGQTSVAAPTENFTPYEQLTEAQVLGWVYADLGTDRVVAIEQGLSQQVVYMQAPPVLTLPLPWQE